MYKTPKIFLHIKNYFQIVANKIAVKKIFVYDSKRKKMQIDAAIEAVIRAGDIALNVL